VGAPVMRPLVSVIVPAYNAAVFIGATLESVRAQTYDNIEVIVVDDGSTDDTTRIVEAHAAADPRVRLLRQANQGVATARNVAAASATGVYLAPIDADDVWLPTKIERQVASMEREGPAVGMCYTWWLGIDGDGVTQMQSHPWRVAGAIADAHVAMNFVGNASAPMFRREVFDRVGGYGDAFWMARAQGCEDWDLSLRIAECSRVSVVEEYLTGYRRIAGTMSGSLDTMARSHLLMLERLKARRPDVPPELLRWSVGQLDLYLADVAARSGAPLTALFWIMKGALQRDASLLSPWIAEVILRKLPRALADACTPALRRAEARWH